MSDDEVMAQPFEPAESKDDYLDDLIEDKDDSGGMMFQSSNALILHESGALHPRGKAIAIFVLFISTFGFLNGLDWALPDQGLIRPDEFVYKMAQSAPNDSAVFQGVIYDDLGNELNNATVYVSWEDDHGWNYTEVITGANGSFYFSGLDPGLVRVDVEIERDGHRDVIKNRVILSPPALIEPIGFTQLNFEMPSSEEFAKQPCNNGALECEIREIDYSPQQMEHPLMDSSAATFYIMVGFGFMALSLIAFGFSLWALKSGSIAILRMSAILSFFTLGHYYTACIFGLVAILMTFAVPRNLVPLNSDVQVSSEI